MRYRCARWIKALGLLALMPLLMAASYDPSLHWSTLFTPHFAIHYHNGLAPMAHRLAGIAEDSRGRLVDYFQWQPEDRVDVVLTDHTDQANGAATIMPFDRIIIHSAPPYALAGLEDYDDWLRLVFVHEYVHILHLDKVEGFPEAVRRVFGRHLYTFPNALEPNWVIEGLATFEETDRQRGVGRGQSTYYRGLMRVEVEDGIKPVNQVSQPIAHWPGGATSYLYGVYFFEFMKARYGDEAIKRLIDENSEHPVPFLINYHAHDVLGKSLGPLWAEFSDYLRAEFEPEISRIEKRGISQGEALTDSGYYTVHPLFDGDGGVYYIQRDFRSQTRLMHQPAGAGKARTVAEVYGTRFDLHPQAGLLVSQEEVDANVNFYHDLYRIPLGGGKAERLTHQGRYYAATWSPDGDCIAAASLYRGRVSLERLGADGQQREILWQGDNGEVINALDWSPDGEGLVASLWRPEHGWDLAWFDLETRRWRALTETDAIESQVRFGNDSDHVIFTADYDGVYNVYRLDLESRELTQLTNVVGGAFFPALSADGEQLVYSELATRGYNIHRRPARAVTDIDQLPRPPFVPSYDRSMQPVSHQPEGANYEIVTDYYAPRHLQPSAWVPIIVTGQQTVLGLTTSGADPLRWHRYNLLAAYDFQNGVPYASLYHTYDRWYPTVLTGLQRNNIVYTQNGTITRIRAEESLISAFSLPWFKMRRAFQFTPALIAVQERDVYRAAGVPTAVTRTDARLGLAAAYRSAKRYPLTYTPSDGFQTDLVLERSFTRFGDYEGERATLDMRYFTPAVRGNVLMGRAVVAGASSGARPFRFSGMSDFAINETVSVLARSKFRLRGYPATVAEGDRLLLATGEWHFPLGIIERGSVAIPVSLDRLHGTLFGEAGRLGYQGIDNPQWLPSVGGELNVNTYVGFRLPLNFKLGVARGLASQGVTDVYVSLQTQF